ncbi:MAG: trehalose-phosphatase [Burkholderiales bacterium]
MGTRKKRGRSRAVTARPPRSSAAVSRDSGFPLWKVPIPRSDPAFFLDFDGTLLDIADRPHEVRIDAGLVTLLQSLRDAAGGALALISGRSLEDVDGLFASSAFCVAGQHGAERRDAAGKLHRHRAPRARLRGVGQRLRRIAAKYPALELEDKGMNFALHYRLAPRLGPMLRKTMRELVKELGSHFELQTGKMVLEIKPTGVDKGSAILEFMREAPFRGRTPVFIGDDRTDEHGFRVVNRLRGHSIKVGRGRSEAHWRLPDAASVRAWLARFVKTA